jgi:hypothetical protein
MRRVMGWIAGLVACCLQTAKADVISVNISSSSSTQTLASGTSAGIVSATNWNNMTSVSSLSNLTNNFGNATSASVSISAPSSTLSFFNEPGNTLNADAGTNTLYRGAVTTAGASGMTVTISGLTYGLYDVYVYASQNSTNTNTLNVSSGGTTYYYRGNGGFMNGDSLVRATSTNSGSPTVNDAIYSVFTGNTGSSFTFTVGPGVTGQISNNLYGFQIVSVPEPGTLLLGGIAAACGGGGVWWKRRKGKAVEGERPAGEAVV